MTENTIPKEEKPAETKPPEEEKKRFFKDRKDFLYYVLDIALNVVIIIGLVFLIRGFVIAPFQVSGQSMCNTLNFVEGVCLSQQDAGEYIIINKFSYLWGEPQRGDVVVFKPPVHPDEYYVKRLIGFPGEKVRIKDGRVLIINDEYPEGFILEEDYLSDKNKENTVVDSRLKDHVFEVPNDSYFLLGDNRNSSSDSRHWRDPETGDITPYVTRENIDGKVWLILWPFQNMRLLKEAEYK